MSITYIYPWCHILGKSLPFNINNIFLLNVLIFYVFYILFYLYLHIYNGWIFYQVCEFCWKLNISNTQDSLLPCCFQTYSFKAIPLLCCCATGLSWVICCCTNKSSWVIRCCATLIYCILAYWNIWLLLWKLDQEWNSWSGLELGLCPKAQASYPGVEFCPHFPFRCFRN